MSYVASLSSLNYSIKNHTFYLHIEWLKLNSLSLQIDSLTADFPANKDLVCWECPKCMEGELSIMSKNQCKT